MAINYGAKLFETATVAQTIQTTLGATVKAGSLVVVAIGGKRSTYNLDVTAGNVTDSVGNTYQIATSPDTLAMVGIAWTRTIAPMTTSDWIKVKYNGTPTKTWLSAHSFENASGTKTDSSTATGSIVTATSTVNVSGSDWLSFAVVGLPYDHTVTGESGANSSTLRDSNAVTSAPWLQAASRNGTTGSTHAPGVTYTVAIPWRVVAVSWPYEALPTGGRNANSGLWAV